jgi:hypothetical protein
MVGLLRQHTRGPALLAGAAVLVDVVVRIWFLRSKYAQFSGDEAVTGVMVRRILDGGHYSFYAGQTYGGAGEAYLQALMYTVLPLHQDAFTLRLVLVALTAVTSVLVYLVGVRVLSRPWLAALAVLVYAFGSWFNIVGQVTSLGFYALSQTLPMGALYAALRQGDSPRRRLWCAIFGACVGAAMWNAAVSVFLVLPALVWMLPVFWRRWRLLIPTVVGFVIGGAPLIRFILVYHALPLPSEKSKTTILERLRALLGPVLRESLGLAYAHGVQTLSGVLVDLIIGLLVAAYVIALVRRRLLFALVTGNERDRRPGDVLLLTPIIVIPLYVLSANAWYTGTPRYLMPVFPALAIGIAALVPRGPRVVRAALGTVLVCAVAASSVQYLRTYRPSAAFPQPSRQDAVLEQVAAVLRADHIDNVYASYWTAMPLQYAAGDGLHVGVCSGPIRFPTLQPPTTGDIPVAYVSSTLGTGDHIGPHLSASGVKFTTEKVGFVTIYRPISGPVVRAC